MYCTKLNDISTQRVSLFLDVTDVLTAIFRNVLKLQVLKLFQQKYFFDVGPNVFSISLLVNDFHFFFFFFLVIFQFKKKKPSQSYLVAQKDFG